MKIQSIKNMKRRLRKKKKKNKHSNHEKKKKNKSSKESSTKIKLSKSDLLKGKDYRDEFSKFAKKYNYYLSFEGKIVYPVEDKLLLSYSKLFEKANNLQPKPKPQRDTHIPPQYLGEILKIWNYFETFQDLLDAPDFVKEDLYYAVFYDGEEFLEFIHHLHVCILLLFLEEFETKGKYNSVKEQINYPFIFLIRGVKKELCEKMLMILWPEFAKRLFEIAEFEFIINPNVKALLTQVTSMKCPGEYNKLSPSSKLEILSVLIEASYELSIFHDEISRMTDNYFETLKEKNVLLDEIKEEETKLLEHKLKLDQMEKQLATKEKSLKDHQSLIQNSFSDSMSKVRSESNKKQKEIDDLKKEIGKLNNSMAKMESNIEKKRKTYKKKLQELPFILHTAQFLGHDLSKNEYWLFKFESDRLYVRWQSDKADIIEENWFLYDKKEDVEQLLKSLDQRGIREKHLYENIKNMMQHEILFFPSEDKSAKMIIEGEDQPPKTKNEPETDTKLSFEEEKNIRMSNLLTYSIQKITFDFGLRIINQDLFILLTQLKTLLIDKPYLYMYNLKYLQELILHIENLYSVYLAKRNSRWTRCREEQMAALKAGKTIEEVQNALCEIYEGFAVVENLVEPEPELKEAVLAHADKLSDKNNLDDDNFSLKPRKNKFVQELNLEDQQLKLKDLVVDDGKYLLKKVAIKLFGIYNEKYKECWLEYLQEFGDSFLGIYFATIVFCDVVTKYLVRKIQKFDNEQSGSSSLKNSMLEEPVKIQNTASIKAVDLDSYRFTRKNKYNLKGRETDNFDERPTRILRPKKPLHMMKIDDDFEDAESENYGKSNKKVKPQPINEDDFIPLRQTRSVSRKLELIQKQS